MPRKRNRKAAEAGRLAEDIPLHLDLLKDELDPASPSSNTDELLYTIFFWQEVARVAKGHLEQAWAEAQRADGLIPDDDAMRAMGPGERVVAESVNFTTLATVDNPRQNFDREYFLQKLCVRLGIKREVVDKLVENAKRPGTSPLSKRVVESTHFRPR